jgi:hypothetical protein
MTTPRSNDYLVDYGALVRLAIFKAGADPEPFAGNSHAAGWPETITTDDRNGFSMRDPLVLGGQR